MTAVKDPDIDRPTWDAYAELLREDRLQERICVLWHAGTTLESARAALREIEAQPRPPRSLGDGRLLSCGAKIYMDGSGGARTAWLYQDWNKNSTGVDTGNRGYPAVDPEIYRRQVRLFNDAGVHVGTHAIGDRAIDWVVDTYAQVLEEQAGHGLEAQHHPRQHPHRPCDRDHAPAAEDIRRGLSRSAGALYLVDRRYLCGKLRPGPRRAPDASEDLPGEGHPVGRRIGLPGDAVAGAVRSVGLRRAGSLEGNLRPPPVRHGRVGGRARGPALLHVLGGPPAVPRDPHGLARGGQGCGHRRVASGIPTIYPRRNCATCIAR